MGWQRGLRALNGGTVLSASSAALGVRVRSLPCDLGRATSCRSQLHRLPNGKSSNDNHHKSNSSTNLNIVLTAIIIPLSTSIILVAIKTLCRILHMCTFDDTHFTDGKVESQRGPLAEFARPAGIRERIRTQIRRTPGHLLFTATLLCPMPPTLQDIQISEKTKKPQERSLLLGTPRNL